jgi:hypothetical protein
MADSIGKEIPEGLTPAARKARDRFIRDLEAYHRKVRNVALNIIVWGPNPESAGPAPQKRKQIRAALIREGHNAMFSEEEEIASLIQGISEIEKEYPQAHYADLIIVLMEGAPGAIAEVCLFGLTNFGGKFFVMMPTAYQNGFVAVGPIRELAEKHGGSVYWYAEEDLDSCNVMSEALKRATAIRYIKYREKNGRRMS